MGDEGFTECELGEMYDEMLGEGWVAFEGEEGFTVNDEGYEIRWDVG